MTIMRFLEKLGDHFGAPKDSGLYIDRLGAKFSERDLDKIWDELVDTYDRPGCPRIATINDAGKRLGLPQRVVPGVVNWSATDCPFCGGSGLVAVLSDRKTLQSGAEYVERWYGPYQEQPATSAVTSVARCSCPDGGRLYPGFPLFEVSGTAFERRPRSQSVARLSMAEIGAAVTKAFGKSDNRPRRQWDDDAGDVV